MESCQGEVSARPQCTHAEARMRASSSKARRRRSCSRRSRTAWGGGEEGGSKPVLRGSPY
eukprot:6442468-Pyramimonas_sp.AAC.1